MRTKIKLMLMGLIILGGGFVNAQEIAPKLKVSPPTVESSIFIGEKVQRSVEITNQGDVALPIKVRVVDFRANDEIGGMDFDPVSDNPSVSAKSWFSFDKTDFILEPQEKQVVNYTIEVPSSAEDRGYYTAILFEPQLPSFYFKENQSRAIPVIGVLNFISVQSLSLDAEAINNKLEVVALTAPQEDRVALLENSLGWMANNFHKVSASLIGQAKAAEPLGIEILSRPPRNFLLRLKNNDTYHLKVGGKLVVRNFWGQIVGEANITPKTILPSTIRQFPAEFQLPIPKHFAWLPQSWARFLTDKFFLGRYEAKLNLSLASPMALTPIFPEMSWSMGLWALPWQFWLVTIFVLVFLVWFIRKHRGRLVLAWQVLHQKQKTAVGVDK